MTSDLKTFAVPTLKVYPGAPHGLATTHTEQLTADLPAFIES